MRHLTERWLISLVLLLTTAYAVAEEITLTTYYPSPRGMYEQLRTTGQTLLAQLTDGVGVGMTTPPLAKLHVVAPGGFGAENADGTAQAGNVPIVAQSDSTAFGIINGSGRPSFALNIDGNGGTATTRGVPTLYDRTDGNWHGDISLNNGNVGIGDSDPGFKLDVADRMRVRQGPGGSTAGIWFNNPTAPAPTDRAFVGMANDTQVGFWGNTGAQWSMLMDTTSGSVNIGRAGLASVLNITGGNGTVVIDNQGNPSAMFFQKSGQNRGAVNISQWVDGFGTIHGVMDLFTGNQPFGGPFQWLQALSLDTSHVSVIGNLSLGVTPPGAGFPGAPPNNVLSGNITTNDVWIRSAFSNTGRWESDLPVKLYSAQFLPGFFTSCYSSILGMPLPQPGDVYCQFAFGRNAFSASQEGSPNWGVTTASVGCVSPSDVPISAGCSWDRNPGGSGATPFLRWSFLDGGGNADCSVQNMQPDNSGTTSIYSIAYIWCMRK